MVFLKKKVFSLVVMSLLSVSAYACEEHGVKSVDEVLKESGAEKIQSTNEVNASSTHMGQVLMIKNQDDLYPVRYSTMMGLQQNADSGSIHVAPSHLNGKFVSGMDYEIYKHGLEAVKASYEGEVTSLLTQALLLKDQGDVYPIRYSTMMGLQQNADEHSINIGPAHIDSKFVSGMDKEIIKRGNEAIESVKIEETHSELFDGDSKE